MRRCERSHRLTVSGSSRSLTNSCLLDLHLAEPPASARSLAYPHCDSQRPAGPDFVYVSLHLLCCATQEFDDLELIQLPSFDQDRYLSAHSALSRPILSTQGSAALMHTAPQNFNSENYLLTPSDAGDLCVAKLFPPDRAGGASRSGASSSHSHSSGGSANHVRCEASRNLRWMIQQAGIAVRALSHSWW